MTVRLKILNIYAWCFTIFPFYIHARLGFEVFLFGFFQFVCDVCVGGGGLVGGNIQFPLQSIQISKLIANITSI